MRALLALPLVLLALAAPAPAQEQVEPWRVVRDLELRGAEHLPVAGIVGALLVDPDVQALLTAPIGADEMEQIAAAVRRVYQRNGFGEVKATGSWADGRGVVEVEEGPRRTCGEIRCVGAGEDTVRRVHAALLARGKRWPGWQSSESAPTDPATLQRARAVVLQACLEAGLFGVEFEVAPATRGDFVDLVATFSGPGHEIRVQRLELVGEHPDARDAVLAGLVWQAGDRVDTAWVEGLRGQLERTGRYRSVRVDVPPDAGEADPLRIAVDVLPYAPPPSAAVAREVQQLQRGLQRVLDHLADGGLLRLRHEIDTAVGPPGLRVLPGTLVVDVGEQGVRVTLSEVQWGAMPPGPFEVIVTPTSVSLQVGRVRVDGAFENPIRLQATLQTGFMADGKCELRWGLLLARNPTDDPVLSIRLHPATAGHLLHGPEPVGRRDGDDLVFAAGDGELRIGPDGALSDRRVDIVFGEAPSILELVDTTLAELRREFRQREAAATTSLAAAIHAVFADQLSGLTAVLPAAEVRDLALLDGVARALRGFEPPPGNEVEAPPVREGDAGPERVLPVVLLMLASMPWLEGWPADLCGALGTLALGRSDAAGACFARFTADEAHGPLALAVGAAGLQALGAKDAARYCEDLAGRRWSFDAAYRDLTDLLDDVAGVAGLPRAIGAEWRRQEALADLFQALPADADPDLAAWRKGLEALWQEGLGDKLRAFLLPKR